MAPSAMFATMSPFSPLLIRDIGSDVGGVKNTLSSWDNCMAKDWCKWTVIVVIVVGSLIALSILLCVVRCCCCGMECCCAACSCINACCPAPRGGRDRTKYRDAAPPPPMPHYGYTPTPAPYYSGPMVPQFATFDASKKINADSLPQMPSWDTATSKKVLDERQAEEHEMDKMDQHDEMKPMLANAASPQMGQAYGQTPYHDHVNQDTAYGQNGFGQPAAHATPLVAGALAGRPGAGSAQSYRNPQRPGMAPSQDSYGSSATGYGQQGRQGFAAGGYAQGQPSYGAGGRPQNQTAGYGQGRPSQGMYAGQAQSRSPNYNQNSYDQGRSPNYNTGYGHDQYDSQGYGSTHGQTTGTIPSAPEPTYGNQQDYSRPSGGLPTSLAAPTAPQNNHYGSPPQQSYQSHQGAYHGSNGWQDV